MAYACYTTHSKFNYKGTDNNDVAVFTGIFVKRDGMWKMVSWTAIYRKKSIRGWS